MGMLPSVRQLGFDVGLNGALRHHDHPDKTPRRPKARSTFNSMKRAFRKKLRQPNRFGRRGKSGVTPPGCVKLTDLADFIDEHQASPRH